MTAMILKYDSAESVITFVELLLRANNVHVEFGESEKERVKYWMDELPEYNMVVCEYGIVPYFEDFKAAKRAAKEFKDSLCILRLSRVPSFSDLKDKFQVEFIEIKHK